MTENKKIIGKMSIDLIKGEFIPKFYLVDEGERMTENKRFTVEIAIHKTREGWANRSIYYIKDSLYSAQKTKKVLGASYVVTVPVNAIVIGENREKLAEEVCSKMNALHEENKTLKRTNNFLRNEVCDLQMQLEDYE